jgi:hypothetical protein
MEQLKLIRKFVTKTCFQGYEINRAEKTWYTQVYAEMTMQEYYVTNSYAKKMIDVVIRNLSIGIKGTYYENFHCHNTEPGIMEFYRDLSELAI